MDRDQAHRQNEILQGILDTVKDIQDEQYQKDLKLVLATKKVLGESNGL